MRGLIAVLLGLALVSPAFAQEEEDPPPAPPAPPPSKTFDVFDDEEEPPADDELPEGDAVEETDETEAPAEEPPPPAEAPPAEVPPPTEVPPPEAPPPEAPPPPPVVPEGPRLLVLLIGEDEEATVTQQLGDAATRALADARALLPMSVLEALDPTADATKQEEIELGRRGIDDGLNAFDDLDLEAAGEKLESAVNVLAAYYGELPEPARAALAEGIFAYAATILFEGSTDQADSVFVALAVLDPSFEVQEGRYPSNVVDRFAGVKGGLALRSTGSLTVKTNPPGAAVYIDGLFRGASPVSISSLSDGYHVVSVRRIGFMPLGTLTPVNGENSATVDLELDLSKDTSHLTRLDRTLYRDAARIADLARRLGVEELAVLDFARRLSGTVVEGQLVRANGAVIIRLPSTDVGEDPAIAGGSLANAFAKAEEAERALANAPPPVETTPLYEEWWFWAAVGGAVGVVAASVAVAATAGGDAPSRNTAIFGF